MRSARNLLIWLVVPLLLLSCSEPEGVETVELWTDEPLLAYYVELFNAEQEQIKVEIRFEEEVAEAFLTEEGTPDIVIGRGLASRNLLPFVQDLSATSMGSRVYPALLDLGRYEDSLRFLPLSFDLPLIQFLDTTLPGEARALISAEELRDAGAAFNEFSAGRFESVGFSPVWDDRFLLAWAQALEAEFTEVEELQVAWDQEALDQLLEEAIAWRSDENGGGGAASAFEERYLYDPTDKLLRRGRIGFAYSTAGTYLALPDQLTENMGFRWLAGDRGVPVLPEIVFAALPSRSRSRRSSLRFLDWLLSPETQEWLMAEALDRNIDSFGFIDGFSSVPEVNGEVIPRIYPTLLGRVPPPGRLQFPRQTPFNWSTVEDEVIGPWLRRAILLGSREEPGEPETPLGAAIDQWYRSQGL
ncbi:MAG: hypothetical protein ACLFP6_02960 [Spirochaetaceae bacterium]